MKKYLLVVLAVVAVTVANAQEESLKPEAGSFSAEIGFSPFSWGRNADNNSFFLPGGELTGIYSISSKFSVRLGLGISYLSGKYDNGESKNRDRYGYSNWYQSSASGSLFSIAPGFAYSFKGTKRLTPYVGAEFWVVTSSNKFKYEDVDREGTVENYSGDPAYELDDLPNINLSKYSAPTTSFGLNLFTGFNYYFSKNIYVGAEVGLGFLHGRVKKTIEKMNEEGSIQTEESKDKATANGLSLYANPQIRLGWAF